MTTETKEAPLCAICATPSPHLIKSTEGMICRGCKAPLDQADNALSLTDGLRPSCSADNIPNN